MTLQPGTTLGRYQVLEPLGVGGMATVYKAYQPSLGRDVALKVLRPGYAEDVEFFQRFEREARSIAGLRHPHIVQVFDFEQIDGRYVLVMEFLEGGTLKERVTQLAAKGQRLPHSEIARIIGEVGSALSYGHDLGVVHRDVKPSNVMLAGRDRAVVTDFGIAKIMGGESQTQTGVGMGTPEYMAPEQGIGTSVDHRADIYSLGVMAYEMLTGRVPFAADTPLAVMLAHMRDPLPLPSIVDASVGPSVERVLLKALAKDPADRYASATAFAKELAAALGAGPEPVPAVPRSSASPWSAWRVRIAGLVALLLLFSGAIALATRPLTSPVPPSVGLETAAPTPSVAAVPSPIATGLAPLSATATVSKTQVVANGPLVPNQNVRDESAATFSISYFNGTDRTLTNVTVHIAKTGFGVAARRADEDTPSEIIFRQADLPMRSRGTFLVGVFSQTAGTFPLIAHVRADGVPNANTEPLTLTVTPR